MFERVTRGKSKLALSIRASLHALASKAVPRTEENPTLAQASKSKDWIHWQEAIGKELDMLKHMQNYDLILRSQVPKGCQILQSKMDLKTKKDAMGRITKRKARLVALGNLEWETIRDTYAPTVNAKTINLMLALSAQERMILYGLDVTGAFLNADIGEAVYIELPERLRPRTTAGEEQVWRLKKTLYGLNRAPKAFYDDMATHLLSHGYKRSPLDPCLFQKITEGRKIIFCVHVDDFAIAATHQVLIDELCRTLELRYQITESDNRESFLGIHILKDKDTLYLSQPGHIAKIIATADIAHITKVTNIPMDPTFNDVYQDDAPCCDQHKYSGLLGMLIYVLRTRPDISYAVNRLATRSTKSTDKDWQALQQVAAYLRTTSHYELVYNTTDPKQRKTASRLHAWSDAAYLTHQDSRSHSGVCFSLGEDTGTFHARSNKQTMVTLSSTEAETYAAVEATKDIVYFRGLLAELGFPQMEPTPLYVDNKSLITLAQQFSGNHKRCKHFLVRINHMIEQVDRHVVYLEHLKGTELRADTLTKAKPNVPFSKDCAELLGKRQRLRTLSV